MMAWHRVNEGDPVLLNHLLTLIQAKAEVTPGGEQA